MSSSIRHNPANARNARGVGWVLGLIALVLVFVVLAPAGRAGAAPSAAWSLLTRWGCDQTLSPCAQPGEFNQPMGLALDASGNVYLTDLGNARVDVFDAHGRFIRQWGSLGTGPGQFLYPVGITVDSAGNVYVGDAGTYANDGSARIEVFDSHGTYLRSWTTTATWSLAVGAAGEIYATDHITGQVDVFDTHGTLLRQLGNAGTFVDPLGIAVDPAGNVYVADAGSGSIQVFDRYGTFVRKWGTPGPLPGQIWDATALTIAKSGNVIVANWEDDSTMYPQASNVVEFTPDGTYVQTIAVYPGINEPAGLATTASGRLYVASNNAVSVYAPPQGADQCMKGAWANFTNPVFKNQGDCVSYFATGGRNPAG